MVFLWSELPGSADSEAKMIKKLDIPLKSDLVPEILNNTDKIQFRCHKGISCFNACCKQADVTLTPYDIIRLERHLGLSSEEFLKRHTVPFKMDAQGVPGVRLKTDESGACLFVREEGCSVYEARPTACRYYPAGLMAMRPKDEPTDKSRYFLIREDHCKGHQEARRVSIRDYRKEQGLEIYEDMNREWLQINLKKRSSGPTIGKPSELSLQLFFMCSFDVDRFRRFVLSDSFRGTYDLEDGFYGQIETDDPALMKFGFRLMKQVLFGEKTIPEQEGALEKRREERRQHREMRRRSEIERHEKEQEDLLRDST